MSRRPAPFFRATSYAHKAGLGRIVVKLSYHDESVEFFPEAIYAVRRDGTKAPGMWSALADLVWTAAEEKYGSGLDHPVELVFLPLLSGGEGGTWHLRQVEAHECNCDPWSDDPCDACGDVGWVLIPKRDERRAS